MPITNSAKKALRQSIKRKKGSLVYRKKMKSLLKEAGNLVSRNKIKNAKELLPQVYKILDKAAKTGAIKKNAAARKKSRITKLINKSQEPVSNPH